MHVCVCGCKRDEAIGGTGEKVRERKNKARVHREEREGRASCVYSSRAPFAAGASRSFFSFLYNKAASVCTILGSCLSFVRTCGSSVVMVALSNKLGYLTAALRVETLTGISLSGTPATPRVGRRN